MLAAGVRAVGLAFDHDPGHDGHVHDLLLGWEMPLDPECVL